MNAKDPGVSEPLLSDREREVLQLVAQGCTSKEVAARLSLSARTVETYRVRMKRKLHARNIAELLQRARAGRALNRVWFESSRRKILLSVFPQFILYVI